MNEMIVQTKGQLVAAIKAAASPTFEEAKANPCVIRLGTTVYTFKDGIHERRAQKIIREIHRTPHHAFFADKPAGLFDHAAQSRAAA